MRRQKFLQTISESGGASVAMFFLAHTAEACTADGRSDAVLQGINGDLSVPSARIF